jgi:hypothetical protein
MIRSKCYSKQVSIDCVGVCVAVSLALSTFLNCAQAAESGTDDRLEKLERAVSALQEENREMKQENRALKQQVAALAGGVGPATPGGHAQAQAAPPAAPGGVVVDSNQHPVVVDTHPLTNYDFKSPPTNLLENGLVTSPNGKSPLSLQIGPVLFTPLGFMDLTSVTRSVRPSRTAIRPTGSCLRLA